MVTLRKVLEIMPETPLSVKTSGSASVGKEMKSSLLVILVLVPVPPPVLFPICCSSCSSSLLFE